MNRTLSITNDDDDFTGAILFIIVVLFWYSLSFICMLAMRISDDGLRYRTKSFVVNLRDQTHTKQILEELVDKEKRDKLWEIYFERTNEKFLPEENLRIRNIERRLANINRNLILPIHQSTTRDIPLRLRRRSSFDQQILERWKMLVEQCKTSEQLPWKLQKLIIRRRFRRYYRGQY